MVNPRLGLLKLGSPDTIAAFQHQRDADRTNESTNNRFHRSLRAMGLEVDHRAGSTVAFGGVAVWQGGRRWHMEFCCN